MTLQRRLCIFSADSDTVKAPRELDPHAFCGSRTSLPRFDGCRNAVLEKLQSRAETERLERWEKVLCALREMRPAMVMNGDYCGVGKSVRRLDRIVSVHSEIERAARAGRACEKQHNAGTKAARYICHAVEPYGVASDIDRRRAVDEVASPASRSMCGVGIAKAGCGPVNTFHCHG